MATCMHAKMKMYTRHLQNDLGRRFVDADETANVDVGPVLGAHQVVFALQVVPRKLNELLSVLHQLPAQVLDQNCRQAQKLLI